MYGTHQDLSFCVVRELADLPLEILEIVVIEYHRDVRSLLGFFKCMPKLY